jgi:hypothetical protein
LTFRATEKTVRGTRAASLYVDRGLTSRLREGDILCAVYTDCGGLGLSVVRDGELVVAVGAVASVPLGSTVHARFPHEVIEEAESLFRKRDPEFSFGELPIELTVAGQTIVLSQGCRTIQGYEICVFHGFYPGIPGMDECVAIAAIGSCPDTTANASAQLFDGGALELE